VSAPRSLITGITGQDGSYLAELLVEQGHEVVGLVRPPLDRPLPAAVEALRPHIELVAADVGDAEAFGRAVRDVAPERLFHLAAPTFPPGSWDDVAGTMRDIAAATGTALQLAGDLDLRLATIGSPEIFGDAGVAPQREDSPRRPFSPYGVAKLGAHELVRVMRERRGVHACSLITYNHESPRRPERFVTRKITRGAAAIKLGLEQELALGDLNAQRDWSHARDVVRGIALAVDHDEPDDYVLASGVARTVGSFVDAAFAAAGVAAEGHVRVDERFVRPPEATVLYGDATKARDVLGWQPEVSFDELVREMVAADLARLGGGSAEPAA
jgi:GDPmannose 4,6-dehydratase